MSAEVPRCSGDKQYASLREAHEAIHGLQNADYVKLVLISHSYRCCLMGPDVDPEDLVQQGIAMFENGYLFIPCSRAVESRDRSRLGTRTQRPSFWVRTLELLSLMNSSMYLVSSRTTTWLSRSFADGPMGVPHPRFVMSLSAAGRSTKRSPNEFAVALLRT